MCVLAGACSRVKTYEPLPYDLRVPFAASNSPNEHPQNNNNNDYNYEPIIILTLKSHDVSPGGSLLDMMEYYCRFGLTELDWAALAEHAATTRLQSLHALMSNVAAAIGADWMGVSLSHSFICLAH